MIWRIKCLEKVLREWARFRKFTFVWVLKRDEERAGENATLARVKWKRNLVVASEPIKCH